MKKKRKSKLNLERIKFLHSLGYDDGEIAKHMKASRSTICYARSYILKLKPAINSRFFTKYQEEVLIGTLLGDSYIGYVTDICNYPCLTYSHCKSQEIYARHKFSVLKNIMSSIIERQYSTQTIIKGKICNIQPVLYARSHNSECLKLYRDTFYPKGVKIIPISFLEKHFTKISLAYLYMDDGCKNGKTYNLNLQCFTTDNLQEFCDFLNRKFNINFTVKKDKTLYLKHNSISKFENLIMPYITKDMRYKIH